MAKVTRTEERLRETAGEITADSYGLERTSLAHMYCTVGFAAAIKMMESDETTAEFMKRMKKKWKSENFGETWKPRPPSQA